MREGYKFWQNARKRAETINIVNKFWRTNLESSNSEKHWYYVQTLWRGKEILTTPNTVFKH